LPLILRTTFCLISMAILLPLLHSQHSFHCSNLVSCSSLKFDPFWSVSTNSNPFLSPDVTRATRLYDLNFARETKFLFTPRWCPMALTDSWWSSLQLWMQTHTVFTNDHWPLEIRPNLHLRILLRMDFIDLRLLKPALASFVIKWSWSTHFVPQ
jgi:hypothetical protein